MGQGLDFRWLPFPLAQAIINAAQGDKEEAELLHEALKRANAASSSRLLTLDSSPLRNVCFALGEGFGGGAVFRRQHMLVQQEITMKARDLAFSSMPDPIREESSRFCELMYRGHQHRFLNRHEAEDPEDFLDRSRKRTLNLTRRIIDVKSMLYVEQPVREVLDTEPPSVKDALGDIWSPGFDQVMLECDRFTRLLGTTSVRPIYDPEAPGKIRLWLFLNHQLRIIPNPKKPWKPAAVIERHNPFDPKGQIVIWTEKSFIQINGNKARGHPHDIGRIPHTFFRGCMSFSSFFIEGEGKSLCDENAGLNDKMSDLNEIIQLQGYSITELVNPDNEDDALSPRSAFVFRVPDNTVPFGVNFKSPDAPLGDLRSDLVQDIEDILMAHGVPAEALGGLRARRGLSGAAIRALLEPIFQENRLTGRAFAPQEIDLADSCLRVLSDQDEAFTYVPDGSLDVSIRYRFPDLPKDTREQVAQDESDVKMGVTTPAEIIQRRNPALYPTLEDAEKKWRDNLRSIRSAGLQPVLEGLDGTASIDELEQEERQAELDEVHGRPDVLKMLWEQDEPPTTTNPMNGAPPPVRVGRSGH